jgi:beta-glucosidase
MLVNANFSSLNYIKQVQVDGDIAYRDLNKNGKMDVYEHARQPIEKRVQDILKQMNLDEKAGMMFYPPTRVNTGASLRA